jgi:hypothetical protein
VTTVQSSSARAYCTYFDSGYLSRGLALIESLREHGDHSPVYVLALDEIAETFLTAHAPPNVFLLNISEIEATEPRLAPLRAERSRMEFYFTCTPLMIRCVMDKQETKGGLAIYLDADLFFFDTPNIVADALGDDSVGIIEHRYPTRVASRLAKYGRFNVGWVGFRDDAAGRFVLNWYADRTIEWCSDKPADGKYADQGYLDSFPDFEGVRILTSAGFNLAPWNTRRHDLSRSGDGVLADGQPLVFFHFHGLRKVGSSFATSQLIYGSPLGKILRDAIYQPYVDTLSRIEANLVSYVPARRHIKKRGNGLLGIVSRLRKSGVDILTIVTGNAIRPRP